VYAYNDKSLSVLLSPRTNIGQRAQPVDARVSPEVDEHDFPSKAGRAQRRRIEPLGGTAQGGQLAWLPATRVRRSKHAEVRGSDRHRRLSKKSPAIQVDIVSHFISLLPLNREAQARGPL